ncbi:MAG: MFS transporter [Synergistaceae bacterium]|jgi:OFA family oxalate/formate antiporter-like MFS transporter|nr:MFS transporter [Synergistaceae bacterium]
MEKKRWLYALNGLAGYLFLGLLYAWSVFVRPLELEFGWLRSHTSLTFSICMAMFCVGGLAAGWLLKRRTPRQVIMISAGCIMAGFLLTSRMRYLYELYVFYGALCGFGVGVGYNVLLGVILQWFPNRQGLISGVLLMGFGFGGSLLGSVAVFMMDFMGWRNTFVGLGTILALLLVFISLNVKRPSQGQLLSIPRDLGGGRDFQPREMLRDSSFYAYYARGVFVGAVGLSLLGNAAPFAHSITQDVVVATTVAGLISIFNGIGRIVGGFVFDKIGSRKTLLFAIIGTLLAVGVLVYAAVSGSITSLTAGYVAGGFFYGTSLPCTSGFISKLYGQKNFAVNFSIMNTYVLTASFAGPYISGVLFTWTGSYIVSYTTLFAMCCAGVVATLLIKRHYIPSNIVPENDAATFPPP